MNDRSITLAFRGEGCRQSSRSCVVLLILVLAGICPAGSSVVAMTTLTIGDVRRLALEHNRTYLSALEDVTKAQSEITIARAGALPEINLDSYYSRNIKLPSFFVNPEGGEPIEFKTGFKNSFGASLSVRQSLWQGGKVFTALSVARLYRKYSEARADEIRSAVLYNAEILFYRAILQQSNLEVLRKAFEANSYNLEVVEKFYEKGLVSEFEVLRARVEKSNLSPQLLAAESELKLSRMRLKSFLGIDLDEEIQPIEETGDTSLVDLLPLTSLIDGALHRRPEVTQVENATQIAKKAIRIARGNYWPELEAVSSYSWSAQSDALTLAENTVRSWSAGINVSIPIFKGGSTRGAVRSCEADYHQALLAAKEVEDAVRLEVEQAYDRMLQAKKTVDIQGETIAQAEQGLKIANLRYESGVGTLLEVLSAQTALTQARNAQALAMFSFREARAQLEKAAALDIDEQ